MEMQAHSRAFLQALQTATGDALTPAAHFPTAAGGHSAMALMPYWREGRRLKGMAVATEGDLLPDPNLAWHHPRWRQHQHQGLRALHRGDPLPVIEPLPLSEGCLSAHGRRWRGRVTRQGQGWWGDWDDGPMPLITLEPQVQAELWHPGKRKAMARNKRHGERPDS